MHRCRHFAKPGLGQASRKRSSTFLPSAKPETTRRDEATGYPDPRVPASVAACSSDGRSGRLVPAAADRPSAGPGNLTPPGDDAPHGNEPFKRGGGPTPRGRTTSLDDRRGRGPAEQGIDGLADAAARAVQQHPLVLRADAEQGAGLPRIAALHVAQHDYG